jgi:hypothetical protein
MTSIVFYLIALTIGPIFLWQGVTALDESYRSNSWPCVDGVIERFSETPHSASRNSIVRGYELSFFYSFAHDGTRYEGTRLTTDDLFYGPVFLLGSTARQRLRAEYAPGTHVSVCYDPVAPAASAVLRPGVHFGVIVRTCIGMFFIVFAGVVWWFERKRP